MQRVKLGLPESFHFSTEMRVRITDVNYGGHLGNEAVLGLIHEARVRFLETQGFSEMDAGGAGLIMVDSVVLYRSEAFHGERLVVDVALANPGRTGFDLFYRLSEPSSGREVARAKTGMAFFDYGTKRVVSMPEDFADLLEEE